MLDSALPALERLECRIAATDAGQIAALHNVVPKLEQVEEILVAVREEQSAILRRCEADANLEILKKLVEEQRNEFDALDFIGQLRFGNGQALWGWEEFHSGVVAWLLDPRQRHGLGDRFLKSFLLNAGLQCSGCSFDWSATEVTQEWENTVDGQKGYLDILIINEAEQALCAIENKVFSSEHSEQLTRYRKALEDSYPTFARFLLFLSPSGTLPLRERERTYWTPVTYSRVYDAVQHTLETSEDSISEDKRAFLRQYATTVRRNIMPETSISQLARRIYLEHREAIDQIIDNRPDWVAEAKQWIKEAVSQQTNWILDVEDPQFVRFRSADWDQFDATQTGNGWAPRSDSLLLFQFRFYDGIPWLDLGLSPGDAVNDNLRQKLFEAVRQNPKLFKPKSTSLPSSWAILHEEEDYILSEVDYGVVWDDGTTRAKLEKWVADFAEYKFPAMNEVIICCLREYTEEYN